MNPKILIKDFSANDFLNLITGGFMKQVLLLTFFCSLVFLFFINSGIAQEDPFGVNETGPITVKSQDVFLLWMDDQGTSEVTSYQKIYRYKTEGIVDPTIPLDSLISKTDKEFDSRRGTNRYVDVATGKFNVDPYDDVVAVWRAYNPDQLIYISIPVFDTTGFFSTSNQITLNAGDNIEQDEEIYVRTGDFDADSLDEFIVAYRKAVDDSVHLCLYDVDSTLQATLVTNYSNTKVAFSSVTYFVRYFVEAADLNNDGVDEIVTCTWESSLTPSALPITLRIYAIENNEFVQKGETQIDVPRFSGSLEYFAMALASGQFDYDQENELVFSAAFKWANSNASSRHYKIDVINNFQNIIVDDPLALNLDVHNVNNISEFSLATGDLNNDSRAFDEVVFAAGNRMRVITVDGNLNFVPKALLNVANGGASDYLQSNNYLKVKDMNMDNKEDVVIVKNRVAATPNQGFLAAFITFADTTLNDGTEYVFARLQGDESGNDEYHQYAIAVGNFDGFDFRIGQPTVTRVFGTVEPVVLLNAPPIHFDKFGNNIFDLNTCFPDPVNSCDFYSTYWTYFQTDSLVKIESHKDWQVSAGLRLSGEITAAPMGIGVGQDYEFWAVYKHGRHFSNSTTQGETQTISVTIQATDDDRIYAIVEDCDVWEYPVFHGNETFSRRSYFAFVPQAPQGTWFGSKSPEAFNYFPKHQIGNILSYDESLGNNNNISQLLETQGTDAFNVDATSSYNKHWKFDRFENVQADTSRENTFDAGAKYVIEATFAFSKKKVSTSTTTVRSGFDLEVNMGSLDPAYSNAPYSGIPYAYWSNDNALVLDYAVNPSLGGGNPTWWQEMYGDNPDPTFVLPWRLDLEKGYGTPANQLLQSKSISFSNNKPDPGDTLTITAQVRNFSLVPTQTPVNVKFYLNDPDSGGAAIIGVNGTNEVSTSDIVSARGRSDVEFRWVVPSGLPTYTRIYAVLDQDNTITEIHEDNNKGYNILGIFSTTGIEDENYFIPEEYVLYQSYPNPFNPTTTIKYSLPQSDNVSLVVYDILGREVAVLLDEYRIAGTYSVEFNASRYASGIYFYQLQAGNFVETKKMILLK